MSAIVIAGGDISATSSPEAVLLDRLPDAARGWNSGVTIEMSNPFSLEQPASLVRENLQVETPRYSPSDALV